MTFDTITVLKYTALMYGKNRSRNVIKIDIG